MSCVYCLLRICIDATNSSDKLKTFLHFLVSTLQLHNFIEWIHYFIVKLLKFCQSNTDLAEIEYEKSIKIIASLYIFFFQKVKIFTMIEINFSNFSCMFLNPNNFFQFELLDLRNLQEQVKKAFCYHKLFWPFTVWINCSCDLEFQNVFSITRTIFSHSRSEQFW